MEWSNAPLLGIGVVAIILGVLLVWSGVNLWYAIDAAVQAGYAPPASGIAPFLRGGAGIAIIFVGSTLAYKGAN